ncbi:MAG TPA: hypothetical protein VF178_16235 [Gemmatimonadaceae bacterium]
MTPSGRTAEIARWEKQRARGRTDFILRRGVVGWGFPAALLVVLYKIVQEQGFVLSPVLTDNVRTAIVIAFLVFPFCGWLFGGWLWRTGEDRYRALLRERDGSSS